MQMEGFRGILPDSAWTISSPTHAELCPVCDGRGAINNELTSQYTTCHGCNGKGWIIVA